MAALTRGLASSPTSFEWIFTFKPSSLISQHVIAYAKGQMTGLYNDEALIVIPSSITLSRSSSNQYAQALRCTLINIMRISAYLLFSPLFSLVPAALPLPMPVAVPITRGPLPRQHGISFIDCSECHFGYTALADGAYACMTNVLVYCDP